MSFYTNAEVKYVSEYNIFFIYFYWVVRKKPRKKIYGKNPIILLNI